MGGGGRIMHFNRQICAVNMNMECGGDIHRGKGNCTWIWVVEGVLRVRTAWVVLEMVDEGLGKEIMRSELLGK